MVEPTMFAVGFACGVIAALVGLALMLGTLKGSGGGRRNPPPPANYKRPAPPPNPPVPRHECDHTGEHKLCTCRARASMQRIAESQNKDGSHG